MKHDFTNKHSENESHLDVCLVPAGLRLTITTHTAISGWFNPAQAPAIALAILEAAGYSEEYEGGNCWAGPLGQAMHMLRLEAEAQERATAEAKERAELEAEALELFKASGAYGSDRLFLKFGDLEETTQSAWLAVARRARELAKEATK